MGTLDTRTRTSTAVSRTLARGLASVRLRIQTQDAATCANARNRTKPHAASGLSLANLPKKKRIFYFGVAQSSTNNVYRYGMACADIVPSRIPAGELASVRMRMQTPAAAMCASARSRTEHKRSCRTFNEKLNLALE